MMQSLSSHSSSVRCSSSLCRRQRQLVRSILPNPDSSVTLTRDDRCQPHTQSPPSSSRPRASCRLVVRAAAAAASGGAAHGGDEGGARSGTSFLEAFWKFLRPHTIRGTILGASAVTARALLETPHLIDWALLPKALMGVLALLCGNGYIVGINQIYDVDIDIVNKPFLPIASGPARGHPHNACI